MISTASPELGPAHAPSLRDRERAEARARRNPLVWLREIIVVALLISSLLRAFIIQVFWIPSPSMRNTLVEDDRIAVSRIDALRSNIHRGDVVVFDDTLGWLGPTEIASPSAIRKIGEFTGFVPAGGEQTLVRSISPFPRDICGSWEITVPTLPTRAITWVRGSLPTSLSPRSLVRFRPSSGRRLTGVRVWVTPKPSHPSPSPHEHSLA